MRSIRPLPRGQKPQTAHHRARHRARRMLRPRWMCRVCLSIWRPWMRCWHNKICAPWRYLPPYSRSWASAKRRHGSSSCLLCRRRCSNWISWRRAPCWPTYNTPMHPETMTTLTQPVASEWHPLSTLPARPRLLVVDDQPINIQTLYQIFHADHEVFMATSGEQALAFCRGNSLPDLILLDVVMPDLDGVAVCQQLKADPVLAHIPVIFVTACMDPADETRALE